MKKVLIFISALLLSQIVFGQNNCERNLNDARTDYATGNLYAIPGKLTDCLEDGFTETEKVAAYQLLALTYININQQDKAKEALIKLLNIKTDYQVIKNVDPDELYSLYTKIETDPIYYIGAYTGVNYTFIHLPDSMARKTKSADPSNESYNYSPALSVMGGVQFIYPVTQTLHLSGSFAFDVQKYEYSQNMAQSFNEENNTESSYSASSSGFNLRLNARYMKDLYYWKPFIEVGVINRLHLSSTIRDYTDENGLKPQPFVLQKINVANRRNFNFGGNLQIGTMKKFQENYWEFALGASYFIIPEIKEYQNQENLPTIANSGYVVEDFYNKLVLSFEIKFNIPFYDFK